MIFFKTARAGALIAIIDHPWNAIKDAAAKYKNAAIAVFEAEDDRAITYMQIRWLKGILLPALEKDSGDSQSWWETNLKLNVMPDEFQPVVSDIDQHKHTHIPSIKILSRREMGVFIVGIVAYLRDETIHGDKYLWVMLPDPELRS